MAELYPDPDPAGEAVPVHYLMQTIQELCESMLPEEEPLLRLHHMLEICILQDEREVQIYQAAHRDLVKDEAEFIREKHVKQNMGGDQSKMRRSRHRTTALLRAIKYAEGRIRRVERVVASEGNTDRQQMARMAVSADMADQINDEPPMQALMGDDAVHNDVGQD
ncbi:MAG: hypothetical protein Q9223_004132 [Gallowayella weberi]